MDKIGAGVITGLLEGNLFASGLNNRGEEKLNQQLAELYPDIYNPQPLQQNQEEVNSRDDMMRLQNQTDQQLLNQEISQDEPVTIQQINDSYNSDSYNSDQFREEFDQLLGEMNRSNDRSMDDEPIQYQRLPQEFREDIIAFHGSQPEDQVDPVYRNWRLEMIQLLRDLPTKDVVSAINILVTLGHSVYLGFRERQMVTELGKLQPTTDIKELSSRPIAAQCRREITYENGQLKSRIICKSSYGDNTYQEQ